ncbi:MAG: hypothetical protein R2845_12230 [Thermomicrobiales bacterium]
MTVEMGRVLSLARDGYLTPIDYKIVDNTPLIPEFASARYVGMACYLHVDGLCAVTGVAAHFVD